MELVSACVTQLDLPENAARGLAGQLLGLIEDTVRERVSFGLAARVRNAVPEMTQWQLAAPTLRPGSLSVNDRAGVSMLDPRAEFESLLARFQVPAERGPRARALAVEFLASRLEPSALASLSSALP